MFVFTVSSCKEDMKEIKKIIEQSEEWKELKKTKEQIQVRKEQISALKVLSEIGIKDNKEDIPLMTRNKGKFESMKILREAGIKDNKEDIPFMTRNKGKFEAIKILREAGIKIGLETLAMIELTLSKLHFDLLEILRDAGVKADEENDILIKIASAHFEFTKALKDIELENVTSLNNIINKEELKVREALSEAGVKIDAGENNILSKISEVQRNVLEIILLVGFKFDLNVENKMLINIALAKGYFEFMKALKDARDAKDATPMEIVVSRLASAEGYFELMEVLRYVSAKSNSEHELLMHNAIHNVHFKIKKALNEADIEVNKNTTLMEKILAVLNKKLRIIYHEDSSSIEKVLDEYLNNMDLSDDMLLQQLFFAKGLVEVEKALSKAGIEVDDNDSGAAVFKIITDTGNKVVKEALREIGVHVDNKSITKDLLDKHYDFLSILKDAGVKAESDTLIKMAVANFEVYDDLIQERVNAAEDKDALIKMVLAKGQFDVMNILKDAGIEIDIESDTLIKMALMHFRAKKEIINKVRKEADILAELNRLTVFYIHGKNVKTDEASDKVTSTYFDIIEALKEIGVKWDVASDLFKLTSMVSSEENVRLVKTLREASVKADAESEVISSKCKEVF